MRPLIIAAISVGTLLVINTTAYATVGCEVVALDAKSASARLHRLPDATSNVLRAIAVGDIVFYPDADLAPQQAEGWVWVRHDITQQDIWQSGIYGWMMNETIAACG